MRRDGFQKPFDLPLLVPRHANGMGDLRVTLGEGARVLPFQPYEARRGIT